MKGMRSKLSDAGHNHFRSMQEMGPSGRAGSESVVDFSSLGDVRTMSMDYIHTQDTHQASPAS